MRKSSYFTALDWIWDNSGLDLVGCIIFAVIYGFSQDEESAMYGNIEDFCRWTQRDERTIQRKLADLEENGYIIRSHVGSGRGAFVEFRCNPEIVRKLKKGDIMSPIKRVTKRAEKGDILNGKGCHFVHHTSLYIENIYKIYCCCPDPRSDEEQQQQIFKIFYWKNAVSPELEVKEFYRYNEALGWKDGKGRKVTSWEQIVALADGWQFSKYGKGRTNEVFLDTLRNVYLRAVQVGDPFAPQLIDVRIGAKTSNKYVEITAPFEVQQWLSAKSKERGEIYRLIKNWKDTPHHRDMLPYVTPVI